MGQMMSFLFKNDGIEPAGMPGLNPAIPNEERSSLAFALVRAIIYEKEQYKQDHLLKPEHITLYLLTDYQTLTVADLNERYEHTIKELMRVPSRPQAQENAPLKRVCFNKQTLLTLAARYSSVDVFMQLLKHPDINPNCSDEAEDTPLHIATTLGRMNIVACLIQDPRIDLSKKDAQGNTARKLSMIHGYPEIEEIIMKASADQVEAELLGRRSGHHL